MTITTDTAPARFDVKAIVVDMSGVHYGPAIAYRVELAIGPARNGHVLVAESTGPAFEVLPSQLFRSA